MATVGALDIQEEVTQDSVFSKRNLVINGLTLVGQVAGGYAFVGSTAAAQGIGAYNSAFVPNFAKFWPDRHIDQEKFLLALGYRTDQTTVIAKQDHGSYYAFFPIETILTPTLRKLFLDDPAVFLNPAEAWLEPGALNETCLSPNKKDELSNLRCLLLTLGKKIDSNLNAPQLLINLSTPCIKGNTQDSCPICGDDVNCRNKVLAEKNLFNKAGLNAARIVVRGVMTIEVNSVPPTIDEVQFDDEQKGAVLWTVSTTQTGQSAPASGTTTGSSKGDKETTTAETSKTTASSPDHNATLNSTDARTGMITGKFLTEGTPEIVDISVTQSDYIANDTLKSIPEKSSDTSLSFTLTLGKTQMPSGTKLTFQASRTSSDSNSPDVQPTAGSSTTVSSNKYVYTVSYETLTPPTPTITNLTINDDGKANVWQTLGKLSGTAKGTNLAGGTISVSSLEIAGKPAIVSDYINSFAEVPKTSDATILDFQFSLVKVVPIGSKVSFAITTKQGDKY